MFKKAITTKILLVLILYVLPLAAQTQIAVLEFIGKNVSTEEASALTDRLRIELFRTGQFKVMEREIMDKILEEQGFQLSESTSNECIVEMGQLMGVERVVAGSVSRVGEIFSIAARLVSVQTGEIIGIATYDYEGNIGQLLKTGMANVSRQLAGTIQSVSVPEPTTQSQPQVTRQPDAGPQRSQTQPQYKPGQIQAKKSRFGIMGSITGATIIGDDVDDTVAPKPGFTTSVYMLFKLSKGVALRPEIAFTKKGWVEDQLYDYRNYVYTADLSYLQIPFLIHLGSTGSKGIGIYGLGGVSAGILLSSTYSIDVDDEKWDSGDIEEMKSGESVLILGSGLFFGNNLHTEMRFNIGMTPLFEDFNSQNLSVDLTLGLAL